jgi:peptidoglycan/xylan/chitin deacetylase (PgdA/CDA1 family)
MSITRLFIVVALAALLATLLPATADAKEHGDEVWFAETGHHVPELFVGAWWRFGGLPIIGFPVTEPFERDGMLVQHFERAVMEWHTGHAGTQYEVQLELLGNWIATDRDEPAFQRLNDNPLSDGDPGYWFPETGHTLQNSFRDYWNHYGGLQVFGYPISQEFEEDGRTVQYFERARFEWHPENAGTVYEVLLGHLGVEAAQAASVDMQPVARCDGVPVFDHRPPERTLNLPVLMYHRIGDNVSRYEISMWNFEQQLAWLRDNGYTAVTLTEVYNYLYGYGRLPENSVVLTFDDGWASHWEAAATLERYGMRGVFFITLDDQPRMPDWQIADLSGRGHEIGGHTNRHPDLMLVSNERLWDEVAVHRQRLQAISGSSVDFFAYPYGSYNSQVIATVEAAGYRGAVAAWGGSGWSHELRWNQPRIEVVGTISLGEFAGLMEQAR